MTDRPTLLLLGDSHLARIRRARLRRLETASGHRVVNTAVGGATVFDLAGQVDAAPAAEVAVLSVATNDAAPWKEVPLETFGEALRSQLPRLGSARLVYVASPGVDESRLTGHHDRTNARLRAYVDLAGEAVRDHGGEIVDTAVLLAGVREDVFEADGVHLTKAGYDVVLPVLAACATRKPGLPGA